ncbi:hypothetical protein [Mycolicibacterium sp. A43C]
MVSLSVTMAPGADRGQDEGVLCPLAAVRPLSAGPIEVVGSSGGTARGHPEHAVAHRYM